MGKFEFLSDEAVIEFTDDRLKHQSIAETLKTIIIKAPLPFTIGLFGKWGAGKSTIGNFLKEKINLEEESLALVKFDVWKYEKDSLRRQFLLELTKQLQDQEYLSKEFEIDSRITSSVSKSFEGKIRISRKELIKLGVIFFAIAIAIGILIFVNQPKDIPSYIGSLFSSLVILIGLTTLLQYITQVITTETETVNFNKFTDPDEFEKEFEKIIDQSTSKRIVILFDNLDRATADKAIELLSTIKTFLEPKAKKCVFLITCDDEAVKEYLKGIYIDGKTNPSFDADEFLRKFFNTTLTIPDVINKDLEEYTREQLLNTKIEAFQNNSDLVVVITQAFRENPRQIKQFVNTLLAHYLLAEEREKGRDPLIKAKTITENSEFLAKILIIKQRWQGYYKEIAEDPRQYPYPNSTMEYPGLRDFLDGTSIITTDNLRAFIYFKQASSKLAIQGIDSEKLEIAFKDNKTEDASKIANEMKNQGIKEEKVFAFIESLLNENKKSEQVLINIINITELVLKEMGISLINKRGFAEAILTAILSHLGVIIGNISIPFVFICLEASRKEKSEKIIEHYISHLGSQKNGTFSTTDNYSMILVQSILAYPSLLKSDKSKVGQALAKSSYENVDILELIFQNEQNIKDYISAELITNLIKSIDINMFVQGDSSSRDLFTRKMNLILNPELKLEKNKVRELIDQLTELLNKINQDAQRSDREEIITDILEYTEKIIVSFKEEISITEADNLVSVINSIIGRIAIHLRTPYIPTLFYIRSLVSEPNKTWIDTIMNQYGQNGNIDSFNNLVANRDKSSATELLLPIKQHIENFSMSNLDMLKFIWEYEPEDDKSRLIVRLLQEDHIDFALNRIEQEDYKLKESGRIVQILLDKAPTVSVELRTLIYGIILKLKCGSDKTLTEKYLGQLEQLLLTTDTSLQNLGYKHYHASKNIFSDDLIIAFIQQIINWLMTQPQITITHKLILQTAFSYWKDLSITYKDNLLTIIFDRLLRTTQSIDDINMVSDIIRSISISKKLLESHEKVLNARIDSETDQNIKTTLQKITARE